MNQLEALAKHQSLFRTILVIFVLLVVIWALLTPWQRAYDEAERMVTIGQARQLRLQLTLLRSLWESAGQPAQFELSEQGQWSLSADAQLTLSSPPKFTVYMNPNGFPLAANQGQCQKLWWALVEQAPIETLSVNTGYFLNSDGQALCQYTSPSKIKIQLNLSLGEVKILEVQ